MFFKKKDTKYEEFDLIKIGALLIHAAKIDEKYTNEEEKIIKVTLIELGADKKNLNSLIHNAKAYEEQSNQILNFTKEVKNLDENKKIKIVEALWKIIYSNKDADMYETNLMRRLTGLLYVDNKTVGDIKEKIKEENL